MKLMDLSHKKTGCAGREIPGAISVYLVHLPSGDYVQEYKGCWSLSSCLSGTGHNSTLGSPVCSRPGILLIILELMCISSTAACPLNINRKECPL